MPVWAQAIFWLVALALLVAALVVLKSILLPFVFGVAVAYLLAPTANRLKGRGIPRTLATTLLIAGFFGGGLIALLVLAPVVVDQLLGLFENLPGLLSALIEYLRPYLDRVLAVIGQSQPEDLSRTVAQATGRIAAITARLLGGLVGGGLVLANFLALVAITPVVAFYALHRWRHVIDTVDDLLPREHATTIRTIAADIDNVLKGFVHGTGAVCLALAIFYGALLSLVGLEYGLSIGLIAGTISFIPYLGTIFGLVASVGLAAYQFWPEWTMVALVFGIFVAGQLLADYVLVPRIVGDRVGLHPFWVIFGLFAGGALFGFLGMLLSVPVAAVVGVLARFAIERYKTSPVYLSRGGAGPEPPDPD